MTYRVLSLFAGIGGFDLGLERTGGFKTVAFCEIEPFAVRVLNKNWPGVPVYGDVRELTAERLGADGIAVDVIVGGFPCQDISLAGHGAGLDGERSGLWSEYARLIGELKPRYVIVENVSALLGRGLDRVLRDLAALGYDAEWHCLPASAVGAPHRRDRIWIVSYPGGAICRRGSVTGNTANSRGLASETRRAGLQPEDGQACPGDAQPLRADVADAECRGLQGRHVERTGEAAVVLTPQRWHRGRRQHGETWRVEPDVGRVAHGVPDAMDRLKGLGNAVVPDLPELIGRAILASEAA